MTRLPRSAAAVLALALLLLVSTAQAVTIDWVTVGNEGNLADTTTYGAVGSKYQIDKYEVTNTQYAEFLNAKATTNGDTLALYNTSMSSDARGGITRTGSGTLVTPYVYTVKSGQGNNPVVFVSFYDSLRFANWMHNLQGVGDTETGAYTLLGGTATPSNGLTVTRNGGATVFLTSEDEWYKAAYHDKTAGTAATYFDYPTSTDTVPYSDNPSSLNTPDFSNTANFFKDDSTANGYDGGFAKTDSPSFVSATNYLTDVGAYTLADSPYGTFDQGGNVFEWDEAFISGSSRGVRGGSWNNGTTSLAASFRIGVSPTLENDSVGFRVASPFSETAAVPEPSSVVLAGIGGMVLMLWYRRRSQKSTL